MAKVNVGEDGGGGDDCSGRNANRSIMCGDDVANAAKNSGVPQPAAPKETNGNLVGIVVGGVVAAALLAAAAVLAVPVSRRRAQLRRLEVLMENPVYDASNGAGGERNRNRALTLGDPWPVKYHPNTITNNKRTLSRI